jgi:hypothetical protein
MVCVAVAFPSALPAGNASRRSHAAVFFVFVVFVFLRVFVVPWFRYSREN